MTGPAVTPAPHQPVRGTVPQSQTHNFGEPPPLDTREQVCAQQATRGMVGGAISAAVGAYLGDKLVHSQVPQWQRLHPNMRLGVIVGVIALGTYFGGRYLEDKCRAEHGLGPRLR